MDDMDPNLKYILDSITYLKWPGGGNSKAENAFWKRLELSMPKKRLTARQERSDETKV